ncbi:MAG: DinB family protein [Kineosporiaceae bacterium]
MIDVERIKLAGTVTIYGLPDAGDKFPQPCVVVIRDHHARRSSLRLTGHEYEATQVSGRSVMIGRCSGECGATGARDEKEKSMATFGRSDDLQEAQFRDADLRGARFIDADLSGVVMRGVELRGADIDSPWLCEGDNALRVNGIDVIPFVEAELNRRFPGRADRRAADPEGLRAAWTALEHSWAATLGRAAGMPSGTVDLSVGSEWSFTQTLRHLVLATDMWLGRAVLGIKQPFHPLGLPYTGAQDDGWDMSVFATDTPSYAEVLETRAGRVTMVRDFLADVTSDELAAIRKNPHDPDHQETTLSCIHTILEEEWEHHRYAVRDLEAIEARSTA